MRRWMVYLLIFVGVFVWTSIGVNQNAAALTAEEMAEKIHVLRKGFAGVKIEAGEKVIYIDPTRISKATNDADMILITHTHNDHFSLRNIAKLAHEKTVFIASSYCAERIEEKFDTSVIVAESGMSTEVDGIQIETVPAYNVVNPLNHPKDGGGVGYILTIDGVRIYHAGDTERIPEMKDFTCDIAMFPILPRLLMDSTQAAEAALDVQAKIVVPMHYYEPAMPEGVDDLKRLLKDKVRVAIRQ